MSDCKDPRTNCTGDVETCRNHHGECMECGERDCPYKEPLHYHHDGCPACAYYGIDEEQPIIHRKDDQ